MESVHPTPKIAFYKGEVSLRYKSKTKPHHDIEAVVWSNDFEAISNSAEKGVCNFLTMLDKKKKPHWIIRLYEKNRDNDIVHHVNGWWFAFKFGSGDFVCRW